MAFDFLHDFVNALDRPASANSLFSRPQSQPIDRHPAPLSFVIGWLRPDGDTCCLRHAPDKNAKPIARLYSPVFWPIPALFAAATKLPIMIAIPAQIVMLAIVCWIA